MNLLELMVTIKVDDSEVKEKLKDVGTNLGSVEQQAQEASGGIGAADIAIGSLIADMSRWGVNAIKNMANTGIQYNAQIETYTAALTTALGSEAAAAEAIEQIKVDAAKTPYNVDGLVSANTYLIQAGDTAEEARETILALTDAVSASGGGNAELQRMAQNLQQIKNVGKASAMDIKQFAIAGIDIYGILADYTGKTTEEVKELDITYEMLTEAIKAAASEGGKYFEANLLQSQTLNGQLSTLEDNWSNFLGNAFSGISETLSGTVLPAVNGLFEALDPEDAPIIMTELAVGVGAIGVAALKASPRVTSLIKSFGPMVAAAAPIAAVTAAVVGMTAAIIDNINTMKEYTNSLVVTDGSVEEMAANIEVLRQKEAELKAQMDSGWGSEQTSREYDMVRNAIALQTQAMEAATTAAEEAANAQSDVSAATEQTTETMSAQQAELVALRQQYVDTFMAAREQVQSWYSMFEKADEIQAASLTDMANNIQSQITFNEQYQQSLETLASQGYGELASQIATMGTEGANYAMALSEALQTGNTEQVEAIAQMLDTLTSTQNTLAGTITETSGAFSELISTINTETAQPFEIILEDNAADIAAGVVGSINSIPDNSFKYINVVTRYSNQVSGTADGYNAQGLDYVPFDGYVASMHKGERIMTAAENKAYSQGQFQSMPQEIRVVAPISVQIDGETIAYATYDTYQQIQSDRGGGFVRSRR